MLFSPAALQTISEEVSCFINTQPGYAKAIIISQGLMFKAQKKASGFSRRYFWQKLSVILLLTGDRIQRISFREVAQ